MKTVQKLIELIEKAKVDHATLSVARPEDYSFDPRNPRLILKGVGAVPVVGASHNLLVLRFDLAALKKADPYAVIPTTDLDHIKDDEGGDGG